jgi:c(7)-type cytochrome triheme protein
MNLRPIALLALLLILPSTLFARWIQDIVVLQTENVGRVEFSHNNHLAALGNNCPNCHNAPFEIVRKKNRPAKMVDMEKGASCGQCHDGTKAFSVKGDCASCHPLGDFAFQVPDAGDVSFSHAKHTPMLGCLECHPSLFKAERGKNPAATMAQMEKGASCGACHDGSTAFSVAGDCETCHVM